MISTLMLAKFSAVPFWIQIVSSCGRLPVKRDIGKLVNIYYKERKFRPYFAQQIKSTKKSVSCFLTGHTKFKHCAQIELTGGVEILDLFSFRLSLAATDIFK